MNLVYGRWTKEELEKRKTSVFEPFQDGSRWLRVRELVVGPTGANYQAEEVSGPEAAPAQSVQTVPPPEPPKQVLIPEPIRRWARSKGLLPGTASSRPVGNGPAYLPKEIRDAYREEFGPEVLAKMLRNESVDARRLYAEEGDVDPKTLYKPASDLAQETLSPEEIQTLYRDVPKTVSEARIRARDSTPGGRAKKREVAKAAAKQITDPIVQQRTVSTMQKTEPE